MVFAPRFERAEQLEDGCFFAPVNAADDVAGRRLETLEDDTSSAAPRARPARRRRFHDADPRRARVQARRLIPGLLVRASRSSPKSGSGPTWNGE
jgi:hypothetical protein